MCSSNSNSKDYTMPCNSSSNSNRWLKSQCNSNSNSNSNRWLKSQCNSNSNSKRLPCNSNSNSNYTYYEYKT